VVAGGKHPIQTGKKPTSGKVSMSLVTDIQRSSLAQVIARSIFRWTGWRTHVISPRACRYVLIGAPHTSNWDFSIILLVMTVESLSIRWMGKDSLFRWPTGFFWRSFGAIPVNRRKRTNMVDQVAALFEEEDNLIIGLSPEGTRNKTSHWRTGFYYIALKADVPIVMAYNDYEKKSAGLVPA
jgi:1-acyl-sn-glycerol-3-phosphate acyltransferase